MRRFAASPRVRCAAKFTVVTLCAVALVAATGCKSINKANTETNNVVESTGTVQATMSAEPTATEVPTQTAVATEVVPGAPAPVPVAPAPKAAPALWPSKIGTFAKNFKGPVWYPKYLPKGYKVDSLDVIELEPGSGLVGDIIYMSGEKTLGFTQGSPTTRDYEIVSVGKVPWGTETADLVHEDPSDTTTPQMIVYVNGGNFAELYGDAGLAELKKVAASMVPVK